MDVIAYGIPVMDLLINIDRQPKPNESEDVNQISWQYGGKVATGIVATKRLSNSQCSMAGTTGGMFGRLICEEFVRHGIDVSHLRHEEQSDSQFCTCISVKQDNTRNILIKRATVPSYTPEEIRAQAAFIQSARYVFLGDSRPYSIETAKVAHQGHGKVVYDADRYYDQGMPEMLAECDYLIASEFVYTHLFGQSQDWEANLKQMQKMSRPGAVVIVTLGEKGLVGLDENGFFQLPAYSVPVVDTTGAGDVFHGAFLAGLLNEMDVREACRYASAAAAIKCTRIGGRAGIPDQKTCLRFMQTGEIDYTEIDERVRQYQALPVLAK